MSKLRASSLLAIAISATALACAGQAVRPAVGPGARLFITKCFPAHGRLSQEDFFQLRDAGFTVVVNKWQEDLAAYAARAATAGLSAMTWNGGLPAAPDDRDRWLGRSGKPLKYARPCSAYSWQRIGDRLVAQAELSLTHPNLQGAILDFEVYDKNKRDVAGFSESYDETTFRGFLTAEGIPPPQPLPAADQRHRYLAERQIAALYSGYNQGLVLELARTVRERIDAVNPRFQVGVYGWGCLQMPALRGLATAAAPALFPNAETYGRTRWQKGVGYRADFPDRLGLRQNLIGNYQRAMSGRQADFPLIVLAGHYPQAAGPSDGTQYRFTARDSFNSVAAADGYWIWTDWQLPKGFDDRKQDWIDAMMAYWAEANGALDRGDWTWACRQPVQVPNPDATAPAHIATVSSPAAGGEIVVWDPMSGARLCSFGTDPNAPNVAIACADVLDQVPGVEVITVTATGAVRLYDPATQQRVSGFQAEPVAGQPANRILAADGAIFVGRHAAATGYEYDGAGNLKSSTKMPFARGLLGDDEPTPRIVRVVGHEAWVCDPDAAGSPAEVIRVGQGLRAIAIADVDTIAGNEVVTLNAGWVRVWHFPTRAPLLQFRVGTGAVAMATGRLRLRGPQCGLTPTHDYERDDE